MRKLLILLLLISLFFSCEVENENRLIEPNLIELLRGKVFHKDIPDGTIYIHFDLSYLGSNSINEQYEGWKYYKKQNDDPNEQGCFLDYSISSLAYGLYLKWDSDTIINNPMQFKLDGIYGQTWIVTKDDADMISIDYNYGDIDNGYTEMSLEDFMDLDCM